MTGTPSTGTAVLIPVKSFTEAKARLASVLDRAARADLARELADRVVDAAGSLPVAVVCDAEPVADWARHRGTEVVWRPGRGLNRAVEDGVDHLAASGYDRVIVAHSDLPLIDTFDEVRGDADVVLAPDRHEDGTNVAVVPTGCGFRFGYGPGSFGRHRAEAVRLGLELEVVRSPRLCWDVDTPDDLRLPALPRSAPLRALA